MSLTLDHPRNGHKASYDHGINLERVLSWRSASDLGQFHALVKAAPLRSVVIEIHPDCAEQLLRVANIANRPLTQKHAASLKNQMDEGIFELTGDTLKIGTDGRLLDGQHRLDACVRAGRPITVHVVFGIDPAVFDLLDQGRKRTAGDILAREGVREYNVLAGAARWRPVLVQGQRGRAQTNRTIRRMVMEDFPDLGEYVKDARLINAAFKHPPSLICAILHEIGQQSPKLSQQFAHEWVHGARVGRNENFDVLSSRLMAIGRAGGGTIPAMVRAALIVITFNHWNAGEVASGRSLTWQKEWKFPKFEFDPTAFKKRKRDADDANTALGPTQLRALSILVDIRDSDGLSKITQREVAERMKISPAAAAYIVNSLLRDGVVAKVQEGSPGVATIYRVLPERVAEIKANASKA